MGSGFRTFVPNEILTSSNVQNFLMDQAVMVFSSEAARNVALGTPETGMLCYLTDANPRFSFYNGSKWQYVDVHRGNWTPAWTAATGTQPAIGNGSITGAYQRCGDLVQVKLRLIFGSTTTATGSGNWRFDLPYPPITWDTHGGSVWLRNAQTSANFMGIAYIDAGGNFLSVRLLNSEGNGIVDGDAPFTWNFAGDTLETDWLTYIHD